MGVVAEILEWRRTEGRLSGRLLHAEALYQVVKDAFVGYGAWELRVTLAGEVTTYSEADLLERGSFGGAITRADQVDIEARFRDGSGLHVRFVGYDRQWEVTRSRDGEMWAADAARRRLDKGIAASGALLPPRPLPTFWFILALVLVADQALVWAERGALADGNRDRALGILQALQWVSVLATPVVLILVAVVVLVRRSSRPLGVWSVRAKRVFAGVAAITTTVAVPLLLWWLKGLAGPG